MVRREVGDSFSREPGNPKPSCPAAKAAQCPPARLQSASEKHLETTPMLRAAVQPAWHEAPWAMLKPQCLAQTGGTNQYFQPLPPLPRLPNSAWPPGPHTSAGPLPAVSSASLLRDMNLREQCDKVRGSGVSRPDLVLGQPTCSSAREGAAKATCSVSHSRTRTRTLDF